MTMRSWKQTGRWLMIAAALFCGGARLTAGIGGADDDGLVVISSGAQPRLACDVHRDGRTLDVVIEIAAFNADGSGVEPTVGLAAARTKILQASDARIKRGERLVRFTWSIPARDLVDRPEEWKRLRMGMGAVGGRPERNRPPA